MKTSPDSLTDALRALAPRFDPESQAQVMALLRALDEQPMRAGAALLRWHDSLLFLRAHPADPGMLAQVERSLRRLTAWMKRSGAAKDEALHNQGLPHGLTVTRFTHDCLRWLLSHPDCRVSSEGFGEPSRSLSEVLALTLPALERDETTTGLESDDLLAALSVKPQRLLTFLVEQLGRLDDQPLLKDALFDGLDLYLRLTPRHARFSKAGNRLPMGEVFFQTEALRSFDARALMDRPLPAPRRMAPAERAEVVQVLKSTMALTARETDPATYMDADTLRVHDLERGLSIALFGMVPARQLPLESYVGFTVFKNGLAVSYGGAWVLGAAANFGMNIFEPYRGGESGYVMCQLLRTYRQAFDLQSIEVDAHQFGRDNPDGIASGAFWFYHRYGFRPVDPALQRLAEAEKRRMAARPGHRSSEQVLLRFTESNVVLHFSEHAPTTLVQLTQAVRRLIRRDFGGQRQRALEACVDALCTARPALRRCPPADRAGLIDVALVARALDVRDDRRLDLLAALVRERSRDPYRYQRLWREFFASPAAATSARPGGRPSAGPAHRRARSA